MGLIIDLYKYFGKFPTRAAIEKSYTNKGVDFSYTTWNTAFTDLQADIQNFNEQLIPDIENYFFGSSVSDLKNANFRGFRNLALLVWWSEVANAKAQFDVKSGTAKIHAAVVYQYSNASFTEPEAVIIMEQCNEVLKLIETQMDTDRTETCPKILERVEYPILKYPIKLHNYLGVMMEVNLGTQRNIS